MPPSACWDKHHIHLIGEYDNVFSFAWIPSLFSNHPSDTCETFHTRDSAVRGALMEPALNRVTYLPLGKMWEPQSHLAPFLIPFGPLAVRVRFSGRPNGRWTDGRAHPYSFLGGLTSPMQSPVCQKAACVSESMERFQWKRQSKTAAKGDGLRVFYGVAVGVKMADRWTAAGRKSNFVIHKVHYFYLFRF